jgi:hypothetical protein
MIGESVPSAPWLVIELSCGRALRVPESIPTRRLAELIAAVEGRTP